VSKLIVTGPGTGGSRREVACSRRARALRSQFPLDQYGSFPAARRHAKVAENGELKPLATSYGHVTNPSARNTRARSGSGSAGARALAGGGLNRSRARARLNDPAGQKIVSYRPALERFVWRPIVLFLLDLWCGACGSSTASSAARR